MPSWQRQSRLVSALQLGTCRILLVSGSLRRGSVNEAVLRAALAMARIARTTTR
jgi:hypothetical protein